MCAVTIIRNLGLLLYYTIIRLAPSLCFTMAFILSNMDWVQLAQYPFFDHRKSPSAKQCDDIAQSITGATKIVPINSLNIMTYSVICNNCSPPPLDRIVTFREARAEPLDHIVKLATETFGPLAPEPKFYDQLESADPPLLIYTMPCQAGISLLSALRCQVKLSRQQMAKQASFVRDLARYPTLRTFWLE